MARKKIEPKVKSKKTKVKRPGKASKKGSGWTTENITKHLKESMAAQGYDWDDDHTLTEEDYRVDLDEPEHMEGRFIEPFVGTRGFTEPTGPTNPGRAYFTDADFNWKYGEGDLIDDLKEYIKTTYGQHYANVKTGTQVLDMYESIGIAIPSCQANAIKYLCRYGKKNGEERKDLYKALHYTILLIHFIELQNREEMEKE